MSSPTLTDKVSKMIRQDILNGVLVPGQKLVVAELKDKYAVGASPIREALVQLSWKKYVQLEPQKGCWVSSVTRCELSDLFESMKIASAHLLKKAIQQGDENWELEVLSAFHKLSRIQHTENAFDNSEWEERHQRFHTALLEGSNAHTMYGFFLELDNQIKRYRYVALNSEKFESNTFINIDEHENLMKLVLAKNEAQALQVMDKHLDNTQRKIESVLPEE
ncbi:GntR family transcriptional regulator [Vibrio sp. S9_S30]|uniref:GntR family transcriptional regulator n=1 Tax=Vibrio sp. S9_S30 TaxID=2720226 RepID=UPI001680EFAB|nr:GntR family transcriptional regulator [Vibrio sp. S9_S30]